MTFKISVNSTKQQEDGFQCSPATEAATRHSGVTPQGELINSSAVTDVSKALPPAALVTSTETPAWQCGNHPWIAGESHHITCPKALKAVERNRLHSTCEHSVESTWTLNWCRGQLVTGVTVSSASRRWPENSTQCRMAPFTLTHAQISRSLKPKTGRNTRKQNNTG